MAHSRNTLNDAAGPTVEDDLGRLIRWGLENSMVAEPPEHIWPKIVARVREMHVSHGQKRWVKRSLLPLAPLLQAVVISALLLAFGLKVDRNTIMLQGAYRTSSTPVIRKISITQGCPKDVLRGYMIVLAQKEKEQLDRQRGVIP